MFLVMWCSIDNHFTNVLCHVFFLDHIDEKLLAVPVVIGNMHKVLIWSCAFYQDKLFKAACVFY